MDSREHVDDLDDVGVPLPPPRPAPVPSADPSPGHSADRHGQPAPHSAATDAPHREPAPLRVEETPPRIRTFADPATPAVPKQSVASVFDCLEYGPAPESDACARAWLADHGGSFGLFINNKWVKVEGRKTYAPLNPATREPLATTMQGEAEDVDYAVSCAQSAGEKWSKLPGYVRARYLYAIARHIQKHQRLLAVIESMDNGKPIRESRDADVPLVARHFYYHAGWAQLAEKEFAGYQPVGVIAQVIPWNFPLLMLAWKIAPAIAMGNTVVLKPATFTRLSALLFAEICAEAGLPPGVVNVITGSGRMGGYLCDHPGVDKVAFTGSTGVGQTIRNSIAGSGKKISLELGGKSPVVVFDSADVDSAVEGVVDAIWFNNGQVCCAGSRLFVQETIADTFIEKLKERIEHLRVGHPLDKCIDEGAIVDKSQMEEISGFVERARDAGADIFQPAVVPTSGFFYPPTLITNVEPVDECVQEEIFGPVLVAMTFRTPKEAVALANNTRFGLGSSVWTENISLAIEVAAQIKAGVVWVNAHNIFDAAAGFGGFRESGFGREGGREGLHEYVRPAWQKRPVPVPFDKDAPWADAIPGRPLSAEVTERDPAREADGGPPPLHSLIPSRIDRTPKMYIGGQQKRPDGAYSRLVYGADGGVIGHVGEGNRKDIRNAVEAAHAAAGGWGKRGAYNRAQILYFIAENLDARLEEFALQISQQTGRDVESAKDEVQLSIKRLFTYAAYADKFGGTVQETTLYGVTVALNEPVGVIGILCPDEYPLLGFVSLVAPAIVRGNSVVVVPSESHPLSATDLYQVLDTSDLPAGVCNIVTGSRDVLAKVVAGHADVDAVWYFGSSLGSFHVERLASGNMKRSFVNYGLTRNWMDETEGEGEEFLHESVEVKNVWIPMGV